MSLNGAEWAGRHVLVGCVLQPGNMISHNPNDAYAGDEQLNMTLTADGIWKSSAKLDWNSAAVRNRWRWSRLTFTLATTAILELAAHDQATKLGLFDTSAVPITMGSCAGPFTRTAASSSLSAGTTAGGAVAMANCDYSRLRVQFEPGTYSLAVWASNFPVPTGGTWEGVYWQARLVIPGG